MDHIVKKKKMRGMDGALHDDKRFGPPGKHSNLKNRCTKQQSLKIHRTKMIELKGETDKCTL